MAPFDFNQLSKATSRIAGRPVAFALSMGVILVWVVTGPMFGFSDSWQLVINTGTTIVTFLMVFLIQNTQNRDTEAMQIKLDELIRASEVATNTLLDLEELDERTLDKYRQRYESLARKARDEAVAVRRDLAAACRKRKMKSLNPYAIAGAAVLCAIAPFFAPEARAATIAVKNCNDSGVGSLRSAVLAAQEGGVIDLRSLACNRILLTSGAIEIPQDTLTLLGRSRWALTLDGNAHSRVLHHTGAGTLRVRNVSIANGRDTQNFAAGGCVWSRARVAFENTLVRDCRVEGQRNPDDECETCPMGASGGAIFAREVRLVGTTVANSRADVPFDSQGGGVYAIDRFVMFNSRLTGNVATNGTGAFIGREFTAHDSLFDHNGIDFDQSFAEQGAIYVFDGQAVLVRSAVVDNVAQGCAAVCVEGRGAIVDSTVARNQGGNFVLRFTEEGLVANSTVATNRSRSGFITDPIRCYGAILTPRLILDSSIVALNTCGTNYALDIGALRPTLDTVTGANNLVQYSRARLPVDTLRVNPKLQTLRDNGGSTPTMALIDGSVAIDRGSNELELVTDQRGSGFPRTRGFATDIGAFER